MYITFGFHSHEMHTVGCEYLICVYLNLHMNSKVYYKIISYNSFIRHKFAFRNYSEIILVCVIDIGNSYILKYSIDAKEKMQSIQHVVISIS